MNHFKNKFKKQIFLVVLGVVLFWALFNYKLVLDSMGWFLDVLSPFILGAIIAFILNVPMSGIEKRLFKEPKNEKHKKIAQKVKRPVSIFLTFIIAMGVITLVCWLVIPALIKTIGQLTEDLPVVVKNIGDKIKDSKQLTNWLEKISLDPKTLMDKITGWLDGGETVLSAISSTAGVLKGIFSSIVNFTIGIIFAIYMLAQKEKLKSQSKKILNAFLLEKIVAFVGKICHRSVKCFGDFLAGQTLEAIILGSLCGIGMTIFRFPNAMIISVLVACTALIPIVGAFLGFAVGFLLICAESFKQAVWFIIFMVILQQIEGNLIYPKVVGNSVGLPALWTLFAITVGGNMFGILGMFLAVPAFSVIYATLSEIVSYRNQKKSTQNTTEITDTPEETEKSEDVKQIRKVSQNVQ